MRFSRLSRGAIDGTTMLTSPSEPRRARKARGLFVKPCSDQPLSPPDAPRRRAHPRGDKGYPFIAVLVIENTDGSTNLCGGSLIDPNDVLTAAHCLVNA